MPECSICCEELAPQDSRGSRAARSCPYCEGVFCVTCLQTYLLQTEEPKCILCARTLSMEHLWKMCTQAFLSRKYREHKENLLLSREKALLPHAMPLAALVQEYSRYRRSEVALNYCASDLHIASVNRKPDLFHLKEQLIQSLQTLKEEEVRHRARLQAALDGLQTRYRVEDLFGFIGEKPARAAAIVNDDLTQTGYEERANREELEQRSSFRHTNPGTIEVTDTEEPELVDRRIREADDHEIQETQEIQEAKEPETKEAEGKREIYEEACPNSACKGLLDQRGFCRLCEVRVCTKCKIQRGEEHTCSKGDLDTQKLIRSDSKRCPKCGAWVHRTMGCDHMFCTACNTAFHWVTLKLLTKGVHNPYYFEWLFANGQRAATQTQPRNIDVPVCAETAEQFCPHGHDYYNIVSDKLIGVNMGSVPDNEPNRWRHWFNQASNNLHASLGALNAQERISVPTYYGLNNLYKSIPHQIKDVVRREFEAQRDQPLLLANLDLRVLHLVGLLDEGELRRQLLLREMQMDRDVEKFMLARMFVDAMAVILSRFVAHVREAPFTPQAPFQPSPLVVNHIIEQTWAKNTDLQRQLQSCKEEVGRLIVHVNTIAESMYRRFGRNTIMVRPDGMLNISYNWGAPKRANKPTEERRIRPKARTYREEHPDDENLDEP